MAPAAKILSGCKAMQESLLGAKQQGAGFLAVVDARALGKPQHAGRSPLTSPLNQPA